MSGATHPCHVTGCKETGIFGENCFLRPTEDRPEIWWCFTHWKARKAKDAAEPKFNRPELSLG